MALQEPVAKFKHLLAKFIDEDHQVVDDTCLEKLLTHLSTEGSGSHLLQLQESREFCVKVLQAYEKGLVSESLLSFALRLHGHLVRNEATFTTIIDDTQAIVQAPRFVVTTNASVQCSYIQMLSAMLIHKSGLNWLVESDTLDKVLKLYQKNHSIYVARECQNFLALFALKLGADHAETQQHIFQVALDSLETSAPLSFNLAIDLLVAVLEIAFKTESLQIPQLLAPQLGHICSQLLTKVTETAQLVRVAKLVSLLSFSMVERSEEHLQRLEEQVLATVALLADTKNVAAVQMFLLQCQSYNSLLKPRVKDLSPKFKLEHQLVYMQVMPLLQKNFREIKKDCVRNFLDKLCALTTEGTKLQASRLRKLVTTSSDPLLFSCRGMHSLVQMKEFVDRDTAAYIFRTLMVLMVQFIQAEDTDLAEYQTSGFVSSTLESLIILVDHFHFTWRETIETTCLLSFTQELLCEPALGARQVSQLLQVMRRAIEDFMPPNLALLVNTLEDTPQQNLGPQLFRCMHHTAWEVRDSALEVVATMAQISADKFPAFQEHLLTHTLCSLAARMAQGDEESYVRVSALKCLTNMVGVACYWQRCLAAEMLPELITSVLCKDSEGLVRTEAAALASALLQHERLSKEQQKRMHLVLASAAVRDLHWEVKLNALEFWRGVIAQLLGHEGMIDGRFPEVTFSTRHKKIVTLDTPEVQQRLRTVLAELADNCCLAVLLSAIHDPDLQVARKAADILTTLQDLLREHQLLLGPDEPQVTLAATCDETMEPKAQNGLAKVSEHVIDGIVSQSDFTLLTAVYRSQLSLGEAPPEEPQSIAQVSVEHFLRAVSQADIKAEVVARAAWIEHCAEHLDSLLSDMLEAREFKHETNDMDCY